MSEEDVVFGALQFGGISYFGALADLSGVIYLVVIILPIRFYITLFRYVSEYEFVL